MFSKFTFPSKIASGWGRWVRALPRAVFILLLCFLFVSCASLREVKLMTKPQEMALGELFAQAIEQRMPILQDPIIEWYLNTRGRQLAELAGGPDYPYQFKVVNTWELNAFAIPGGHVFINLGMIDEADSEAELLGVVAHEIGHVVERHGNERVSQQQLVGIAGSIVFNEFYNQWAYLAANMFTQVGFLKMSRDDERQSDTYAVTLLTKAGYDPVEVTHMYEALIERQKRQPNLFEKLWLTHPPSPERIENIKADIAARGIDSTNLKKNSPEWDLVKAWIKEHYPRPKSLLTEEEKAGAFDEETSDVVVEDIDTEKEAGEGADEPKSPEEPDDTPEGSTPEEITPEDTPPAEEQKEGGE
ncbi:M48 family metalloprotease [Acidobacteriota bacterium]